MGISPYYDLYGIVNHYGSLNGGHYTAYCKLATEDMWYHADDTKMKLIAPEEVKKVQAYILVYEKRDVRLSKDTS